MPIFVSHSHIKTCIISYYIIHTILIYCITLYHSISHYLTLRCCSNRAVVLKSSLQDNRTPFRMDETTHFSNHDLVLIAVVAGNIDELEYRTPPTILLEQ